MATKTVSLVDITLQHPLEHISINPTTYLEGPKHYLCESSYLQLQIAYHVWKSITLPDILLTHLWQPAPNLCVCQ